MEGSCIIRSTGRERFSRVRDSLITRRTREVARAADVKRQGKGYGDGRVPVVPFFGKKELDWLAARPWLDGRCRESEHV